MSTPGATEHRHRVRQAGLRVAVGVLAGMCLAAFLLALHPFLAPNDPVRADVLIVEGWVPDYVLDGATAEFRSGRYRYVFVSGFSTTDGPANGTVAARYLITHGVDPAVVAVALAPPTRWNRTSHMARAVAHAISRLATAPYGVNVVTLGPHGRQSRLAYRRMLGDSVPVGVITIPKDDYDPDYWWASLAGIKKTSKDSAGWLKECVFGLRQ